MIAKTSQPLVRPEDTTQQARLLRTHPQSKKVRREFYPGTRVVVVPVRGEAPRPGAQHGEVVRHVPGLNSQGGYLLVRWDSGREGRVGAINLIPEALA